MELLKAYKVEIKPNNKQKTEIRKNFGASRYAFNFALEHKKQSFDAVEKTKIPNSIELHRKLNKIKGTDELPWAYEVSKCSFHEALRDCDKAFQNFFRRCKINDGKPKGFPKFKSKHDVNQTFRLNGVIRILGDRIQLPRLGKIKLKEIGYLPIDGRITSATVSHKAGRFYVSLQIKFTDYQLPEERSSVIGIDLGIKEMATCSDGTVYQNPKALRNNLKKLKRKQRHLSRSKKGSNNRNKRKLKLQKLYVKISNIRKDAIHKMTSKIINENQVVIIEDLRISNMMKNHNLARSISDVGFYEIRRQLEYKAKWNGREIWLADTFYPSSKTCSNCGYIKNDLKLSDRTYSCANCEMEIDRDLNASINLKQLYTVSSTGINDSGDRSSTKFKYLVQPVDERVNKHKSTL